MIKRLLPALAAAALALSGLNATAAHAHPRHASVGGNGVDFWVKCGYTGISATMDPIVAPGSTATPHFHDFYGNTAVSPNSTPASLQASGGTSCTTSTDTAAYWAPALVLHPGETQTYGAAGFPCATDAAGLTACHYGSMQAYYSRLGQAPASLLNLPFGMETVGADSAATGVQGTARVQWECGGTSPKQAYPYDCSKYIDLPAGHDGVIMVVHLPRCWNGLDATNRANFAYPSAGSNTPPCPAAFPRVIPLVSLHFHTGIVTPCPGQSCPAGSAVTPAFGFELANGTEMPWYQAHADFMNGWQYAPADNPGGLDDLVQDCLISQLACPPNPHTGPVSNMPS